MRAEASFHPLAARRWPRIALVGGLLLGMTLAGFAHRASAATLTVARSVAHSSDDARTTDAGGFTATENTVLIGTGNGPRVNVAGFRFTNITIPRNATIVGVEFSLVKGASDNGRIVAELAFEASDDAESFSSASPPGARPHTVAGAPVDDTRSRLAGQRYTIVGSVALVESLREVISRPGWNPGNSLALIVTGAMGLGDGWTDFRTSDAGLRTSPRLAITWQMPTTVSPPATPDDPVANLTPVAGQPCPAWVHDRYRAVGPDGKTYPTWHASVDPLFRCTFGHEHGDYPHGSPALRGRTVLFGYASIKAGMDEPHTGFKVFRWDNVQTSYGPSHNGASYLAVLHQGTSGAGRFSTVFHDIEVHYYHPADGRELHVHMLAPFGRLMAGCGANDPRMELNLEQFDAHGARVVATSRCFAAPNIPYEDWLTALYVGGSGQDGWKAYLDPHFAVFNPNTFCVVENGACTLGYSDTYAATGSDPAGVGSDYKGAKRETYLNQVWLRNSGGSTTLWTDPFGLTVSSTAPGAIEQYVSAVTVQPAVESTAFGAERNPDPDGSVHAPN